MRKIGTVLLVIMVFGCKSGPQVVHYDATTEASAYPQRQSVSLLSPLSFQKKRGFRYQIPNNMQEAPDYAYRLRYDNLLLEKGADYTSSALIIAIRHFDLQENEELKDFVKMDQSYLKQSIRPSYKKGWKPKGLDEKEIEYAVFEFAYKMQKNNIYQRSVYLRCEDRVHIISLSSPFQKSLEEADYFWETIRID